MAGRLKPGVESDSARAEFRVLASRVASEHPDGKEKFDLYVSPGAFLSPDQKAVVVQTASLVMLAVSLILVIICANTANMQMARAAQRRKEIATRIALGATRGHLLRQLLTESLVVSTLGGLLGLFIAAKLAPLLPIVLQSSGDRTSALDFTADIRVLCYTLLLSTATAIVFGLLPALQASRPDVVAALRDSNTSAGFRPGRIQMKNILMVVQVSVCASLLLAAGLLVGALRRAQSVDLGFAAQTVLTVSVGGMSSLNPQRGQIAADRIVENLAALPGVRSVAMASLIPLGSSRSRASVTIDDEQATTRGTTPRIYQNSVSARYFETLGIPVLRGRAFKEEECRAAAPVVIISQAMARRYWGTADPIGRRIRTETACLR